MGISGSEVDVVFQKARDRVQASLSGLCETEQQYLLAEVDFIQERYNYGEKLWLNQTSFSPHTPIPRLELPSFPETGRSSVLNRARQRLSSLTINGVVFDQVTFFELRQALSQPDSVGQR